MIYLYIVLIIIGILLVFALVGYIFYRVMLIDEKKKIEPNITSLGNLQNNRIEFVKEAIKRVKALKLKQSFDFNKIPLDYENGEYLQLKDSEDMIFLIIKKLIREENNNSEEAKSLLADIEELQSMSLEIYTKYNKAIARYNILHSIFLTKIFTRIKGKEKYPYIH